METLEQYEIRRIELEQIHFQFTRVFLCVILLVVFVALTTFAVLYETQKQTDTLLVEIHDIKRELGFQIEEGRLSK